MYVYQLDAPKRLEIVFKILIRLERSCFSESRSLEDCSSFRRRVIVFATTVGHKDFLAEDFPFSEFAINAHIATPEYSISLGFSLSRIFEARDDITASEIKMVF